MSRELCDYNMYMQDEALREAVIREGAEWANEELNTFGHLIGSAEYMELGSNGHHNYGTLPTEVDCAAIIERATPQV